MEPVHFSNVVYTFQFCLTPSYKHDTRAYIQTYIHTHAQLQTNHKLSLLVASKRDPLNPSWLMEADSALYLNELLLVSGLKEKTTKGTIAKLLGATTVQVNQQCYLFNMCDYGYCDHLLNSSQFLYRLYI
jgi:16S rRNA G1207 methylase RsmC